jgi:regulator of sigma E protease
VSIDGKPAESFDKLRMASIFSGKGQVLRLEVQQPGAAQPRTISVSPRMLSGALHPTLGILPAASNELPDILPFIAPAGFEGDAAAIARALKGGGIIESAGVAGGEPWSINSVGELQNIFAAEASQPIEIRVRRGSFFEDKKSAAQEPVVSVTLPPVRVVDFGLRMEHGPIAALRGGGPAQQAGVKAGDRLVAVDGDEAFDPMRLPDAAYRAAKEGREMAITVMRPASGDKEAAGERLSFSIKPEALPPRGQDVLYDALLDVPGLGLALPVGPKVAAVRPGSAADSAGIKAGEKIRSVTLNLPGDPDAPAGSEDAKPVQRVFLFDAGKPPKGKLAGSWPGTFVLIQNLPRQTVRIEFEDGHAASVEPAPAADWYWNKRGLQLVDLLRKLPPQSLPTALALAWGETADNIVSVFSMIRGLVQGRVSNDAVGGPVPIVRMAFSTAKAGFDSFIPLLGILSINLAVVNFFPIPPLDGGQMLFLIAEKVRGRPVPERLATPLILAGLAMILLLFLLVNIKDVFNLFR